MRLTQENIKDSLAQKFIMDTLRDIKEAVNERNYEFGLFTEGYYNRVPKQF
jgi:hypothetical protein